MSKMMFHLVQARIEQEAEQLQKQGYSVERPREDMGFDLVASKSGEKIAFQIKSAAELYKGSENLQKNRETAKKLGFDELKLVVVTPPREREIHFDDLGSTLLDHIVNVEPLEFDALPGWTMIEDLADIDIDYIAINESGIRVKGSASVDVTTEVAGGEAKDGVDFGGSYPLEFDVTLNLELGIEEVHHISVNTDSFFE